MNPALLQNMAQPLLIKGGRPQLKLIKNLLAPSQDVTAEIYYCDRFQAAPGAFNRTTRRTLFEHLARYLHR